MKTLVHLNESTQLSLNISFLEFEKLIEENNDKKDNFIYVDCYQIHYFDDTFSPQLLWKKFKLYIKRILFFYEE